MLGREHEQNRGAADWESGQIFLDLITSIKFR